MAKKNRKLEVSPEAGSEIPAYSPGLGNRIAELINALGGLKAAAVVASTSEDSLANWRDGRSRPSFYGLQALAHAAGRSLDWLATGEGPMRRPQPGLAEAAVPWSGRRDDARLAAVADRLRASRLAYEEAVRAVAWEPPPEVREAVRTIAFLYGVAVDDLVPLLDCLKSACGSGPR